MDQIVEIDLFHASSLRPALFGCGCNYSRGFFDGDDGEGTGEVFVLLDTAFGLAHNIRKKITPGPGRAALTTKKELGCLILNFEARESLNLCGWMIGRRQPRMHAIASVGKIHDGRQSSNIILDLFESPHRLTKFRVEIPPRIIFLATWHNQSAFSFGDQAR